MEAPLLLLFANLKPELYEDDSGVDDVFFDLRRQLQEPLVSFLGHKTHHMFYAGAVVPAAVEDDELTGCREVFDVTLEEQLAFLPLGRRGQGNDPEYAGTDPFRNRPNGAAFAGRVAPFEGDNDPQALLLDPLLQMAKLDLKLAQLGFI